MTPASEGWGPGPGGLMSLALLCSAGDPALQGVAGGDVLIVAILLAVGSRGWSGGFISQPLAPGGRAHLLCCPRPTPRGQPRANE